MPKAPSSRSHNWQASRAKIPYIGKVSMLRKKKCPKCRKNMMSVENIEKYGQCYTCSMSKKYAKQKRLTNECEDCHKILDYIAMKCNDCLKKCKE